MAGDQWASLTSETAVTVKSSPSLAKVVWKASYRPAGSRAAGWSLARDGDVTQAVLLKYRR